MIRIVQYNNRLVVAVLKHELSRFTALQEPLMTRLFYFDQSVQHEKYGLILLVNIHFVKGRGKSHTHNIYNIYNIIILYYIVLYYIYIILYLYYIIFMLYYIILYYVMLCYIILYYITLYYIIYYIMCIYIYYYTIIILYCINSYIYTLYYMYIQLDLTTYIAFEQHMTFFAASIWLKKPSFNAEHRRLCNFFDSKSGCRSKLSPGSLQGRHSGVNMEPMEDIASYVRMWIINNCLVVWNIFFHILGIVTQLTFIFFRGVETTNNLKNNTEMRRTLIQPRNFGLQIEFDQWKNSDQPFWSMAKNWYLNWRPTIWPGFPWAQVMVGFVPSHMAQRCHMWGAFLGRDRKMHR